MQRCVLHVEYVTHILFHVWYYLVPQSSGRRHSFLTHLQSLDVKSHFENRLPAIQVISGNVKPGHSLYAKTQVHSLPDKQLFRLKVFFWDVLTCLVHVWLLQKFLILRHLSFHNLTVINSYIKTSLLCPILNWKKHSNCLHALIIPCLLKGKLAAK